MPLEHGLAAFGYYYSGCHTNDETLTAFFDRREQILAVFRNNPELVAEPYPYSYNGSNGGKGYTVPGQIPEKTQFMNRF